MRTTRVPRALLLPRGLHRVRVVSTALTTRQIGVDETTTVGELKVRPASYILHRTPYTLHPTPYTILRWGVSGQPRTS